MLACETVASSSKLLELDEEYLYFIEQKQGKYAIFNNFYKYLYH